MPFYTNNRHAVKEIRKAISYAIGIIWDYINMLYYLRIILIEEVEEIYNGNFKTLKKEIEEET